MPSLFRIRGGDRGEYGPASPEQIQDWIREGRVDRITPVRLDDSPTWHRLEEWPEFAPSLPPPHPRGRPLPDGPLALTPASPEELRTRPVRLHVLDTFADGLVLLIRQPRALLGASTLVVVIALALVVLSAVPFALVVTAPLALALIGPFWAGMSQLCLRAWRGHAVRVRDLFDGFRTRFRPLLGASMLLLLLTLGAALPGIALIALGVETGSQAQDFTPKAAALVLAGILLTPGLALLPLALWGFTPALILDRGLDTRTAFRWSRRITSLTPLRSLLFSAACALLLLVGLLLGGFGLLATAPWVFAARARAYEETFGPRHAPPA